MSTHPTNSLCTKLSSLWRISWDSYASAGYPHVAQTRVGYICHMSKSLRVTIQPAAKPLQFPAGRGHTAEGRKRQGARVRRVTSVSPRLQERISDGARPRNISRSDSRTQGRPRDDRSGRLEIAAAAPHECDDAAASGPCTMLTMLAGPGSVACAEDDARRLGRPVAAGERSGLMPPWRLPADAARRLPGTKRRNGRP